jgi:hypothetical protein
MNAGGGHQAVISRMDVAQEFGELLPEAGSLSDFIFSSFAMAYHLSRPLF